MNFNKALLHQWRSDLNLTMDEMPVFLGIPKRTYQNWEKGLREPSAAGLALIDLLKQVQILAPVVFSARLKKAKEA